MKHIELQVAGRGEETAEEQVVADAGDTGGDEITEDMEAEVLADEEGERKGDSPKLPGVDEVLRDVTEKLSPEHAEVIKGLQRTMVQNNELESLRRDLQRRIDELDGKVSSSRETGEEDEEGEDPFDGVPPEQLELLELYLKRNGFIRQSDLDAEKIQEEANASNARGIELWGEEFGHINENGEFEPSEEAREKMAPVFDRLVNEQNLTFYDLQVLANHDEIVEKAKQEGAEAERQRIREAAKKRTQNLQKGTVATRTANGNTTKPIYDREAMAGMGMRQKISAVLAKARPSVTS